MELSDVDNSSLLLNRYVIEIELDWNFDIMQVCNILNELPIKYIKLKSKHNINGFEGVE
jgi:hypothetical protein